jgi:serralysin
MATFAELQTFADRTALAIPFVDYQLGAPAGQAFRPAQAMGADVPGALYDPKTKVLHVRADGLTLSGYNFDGLTVSVEANNITLRNSHFDASVGVYSVIQAPGKSGLTIDHSTFDGLKLNRPFADFINGREGEVKIAYNQFLNVASDAIQIKRGLIEHNYFSGAGYAAGAHADAITLDHTLGKVVITDNFIDYRNAPDALAATTSAISIGNYFGDNADISVTRNVLLGGSYTVYVHDFGRYATGLTTVAGNYIGAGAYGDLYPNGRPASLIYQDNGKTGAAIRGAQAGQGTQGPGGSGAAGAVEGTEGSDWLHGTGGSVIGHGGRDYLFGSSQADRFVYEAVTDSAAKAPDVIADFTSGVDKIDLSLLAGPAHLDFIGDAAFDGRAGSVHAVASGPSTFVEADMNGDRVADFRIELKGAPHLAAYDFIL